MDNNANSYDSDLPKTQANYVPFSPLGFLERSALIYPHQPAVIYNDKSYTWAETYARCRQFASALSTSGIQHGDTVSVIAPNIPAMYEAHFAVPMSGAVLNTINTRLDAESIAFILEHAETKMMFADIEFSDVVKHALRMVNRDIELIVIADDAVQYSSPNRSMDYETFISQGKTDFRWHQPADEWNAISLNYTSGTTGNPKGVVYHYRGAYLNALSNALNWKMSDKPVYLWTLPMFHCNGWCFPWTIAMLAGTNVCMRRVDAASIYAAIKEHRITHFCGAPIVLGFIINADESERQDFSHTVEVMTAAAPPPASVLERMENSGFHMTHVYGLTETYGPAVVCEWNEDWNILPNHERAERKARQGVPYTVLADLRVMKPETLTSVPDDGLAIGEVMFRGNNVMKGYLKNPDATREAFAGGWFHSGDLGVMHEDRYIELKDRSKDIIISGGENISSIEIENVLYSHPAVLEAAVVAKEDDKWGETPCAFIKLNEDFEPLPSAVELIEFCKNNMARYKAPRHVIFSDLPKTSTGKIQKFILRQIANAEES